MLLKRTVAALTACAALLAAPAMAVTQEERQEHLTLYNALQRVGVTVVTNTQEWCSGPDRFYGVYSPLDRAIIICQHHATNVYDGQTYRFNGEDLDTLRHEAHHLVQDCLDGRVDGSLRLLFDDEASQRRFFRGQDALIAKVNRAYGDAGTPERVIELEREAFVVAASVPADTIASAVERSCRNAR